ncbi:hypothetical protein ACVIVD_008424 [Bradyrhizobium liaoningense]
MIERKCVCFVFIAAPGSLIKEGRRVNVPMERPMAKFME